MAENDTSQVPWVEKSELDGKKVALKNLNGKDAH